MWRRKFSVCMFWAIIIVTLILYLPGLNISHILYTHHVGFRVAPGLLTVSIAFVGGVLLITVVLWTVSLYNEDLFTRMESAISNVGLPNLDAWLLMIAIVIFITLLWTASYYVMMAISMLTISIYLHVYKVPTPVIPPPLVPIPIKPRVEVGVEERTYEWSFPIIQDTGVEGDYNEKLSIMINVNRLTEKRERNPSKTTQSVMELLKYLVQNGMDPEVIEVASHVRSTTINNGFSNYIEILNTISFVQEAIEYKSDKETMGVEEYWRFPIETLYDKVGDCECKSILAAALLKALNRNILFVLFPKHVGLAIEGETSFPSMFEFIEYKGKFYYYCELTAKGWLPGEIPKELCGKSMKLIEV